MIRRVCVIASVFLAGIALTVSNEDTAPGCEKCAVCDDCEWTCAKALGKEKAMSEEVLGGVKAETESLRSEARTSAAKAKSKEKEASRWSMQVEGLESALSTTRASLEAARAAAAAARLSPLAAGLAYGRGGVLQVNATAALAALRATGGALVAAARARVDAGLAAAAGPAAARASAFLEAAGGEAAVRGAALYESAWAAARARDVADDARREKVEAAFARARGFCAAKVGALHAEYVVEKGPALYAAHAAPLVAEASAAAAARWALARSELLELLDVALAAAAAKYAAAYDATPSVEYALRVLYAVRVALAKQFDKCGAGVAELLGVDYDPTADSPSPLGLRTATAGMACWAAFAAAVAAVAAMALARALVAVAAAVAGAVLTRAIGLAVYLPLFLLKIALRAAFFFAFLPLKILFLPITVPYFLFGPKKKKKVAYKAPPATSGKATTAKGKSAFAKPKKTQRR